MENYSVLIFIALNTFISIFEKEAYKTVISILPVCVLVVGACVCVCRVGSSLEDKNFRVTNVTASSAQ